MEIFLFIALPIAGFLLGWLPGTTARTRLQQQLTEMHERYQLLTEQLKKSNCNMEESRNREANLREVLAGLQAENNYLKRDLDSQQKNLTSLQQQMKLEFSNLARGILAEQSEQLSKTQHHRLELVLEPLRRNLAQFEKKVHDTHQQQALEARSLKDELKRMEELNLQLLQDARHLTNALRSDVKTQGNWGEMILEKVLESSGLTKGREYVVQGEGLHLKDAEGKIFRPDVIINLPDKKHLIIDSKVSLTAYENYLKCQEEAEQKVWLGRHLKSVKDHIERLSSKFYHQLQQLDSPEFVLLFMPVEASFSLAWQQEEAGLFRYAWERHIVLVSPSTLLATLRTVASIWKGEKQQEHAQKIAEESGKLYDKLYGFLSEMEKLGRGLSQADKAYEEAMRKLQFGKGSLLDRAERLKEMGVPVKKSLEEYKK